MTQRPTKLKLSRPTSTYGGRTHQGFIGIQGLHHEKSTLEACEVTKLHYRDLTSSNDEFSSYAQSIKLISTRSTTHLVNNQTLDLYPEGAMKEDRQPRNRLSLLFHLSPAILPSTNAREGRLCQPQDSPHSPLTRLDVIISYSLRLERKIT